MPSVKKSATLDAELVREIEDLVRPRGLSAFLHESAKMRLLAEPERRPCSRRIDAAGERANDLGLGDRVQ